VEDAAIQQKLQQKFREAGVFPEVAASPLPGRSGYRISFQPEKEGGHYTIQMAFFEDGICQNQQQLTLPPYSQEEVFRNMLALRALDVLRRQLPAS
jgi:hypothetical protein